MEQISLACLSTDEKPYVEAWDLGDGWVHLEYFDRGQLPGSFDSIKKTKLHRPRRDELEKEAKKWIQERTT